MDIGDAQPFDEPVMPELPELTEPFLHSSHDEPTIVDELSPFASTSHTPVDASSTPPEAPLTDVDVHEINDDEDLELLFPDD